MFIGREKELRTLEKHYASNKFECIAIYGRRRVGKTTIINQFIKNKKTIYFTGLETNAENNLLNLSKSILAAQGHTVNVAFPSYQAALDEIYRMSQNERIVLVIDEYPYLAASYPTISSQLQIMIDHKYKNGKLFIILCGSSMSFMEKQVLGYQSPLFGRRTAQLKILPFGYFDTKNFFIRYTNQEIATIYGITGGIPQYIAEFNENISLAENIKDKLLDTTAYLFEEPANLLKQELREPAAYNAVIEAIANGYTRLAEIATKANISSSLCSTYLSSLISLGIVTKDAPLGNATTRKTIYLLSDGIFRFWYKFIPSNIALIQQGKNEIAYNIISEQLPAYTGFIFEDICKEYLWRINGTDKLPFIFSELGRWWGNDKRKKQETEVDIVAHDPTHKQLLLGECKWTNSLVDKDVLDDLLDQGALFTADAKFYYLFAKTGFTEKCRIAAQNQGNVILITFEEMNE